MFKAPRHLEPLQLRDRELPGSEAIEAFLNNPNLANADRKFLEMADQQLRANWLVAENQTHRKPWAELYFFARIRAVGINVN